MIVFGIKNCDRVKKATTWLTKHKINFSFHDYKTEGITQAKLKSWSTQLGWETLMNKKSTTWRSLDTSLQASITNEKAALALMVKNTSLIKRPLVEVDGKVVLLGFNSEDYERILLPGKT